MTELPLLPWVALATDTHLQALVGVSFAKERFLMVHDGGKA